MSGFRTKLDYSNNRQIKQFEKTNTILSGGTKFGLPFSALTTGPNLDYSAVTNSYLYGLSSFSGNDTTTIFNWFDSNMQIAEYAVTAITPTTSADTQEIENIFVGNNQNTLDGNTFYVDYSGISFDIHVNYMIDLGGGNYSGTVEHSYIDFLSASSLDYQSRTIWIDNPEITRTDRLIITREPQIGYVWTCIDSEGMGAWAAVSGGTSSSGNTLAEVLINGNSTGDNWIDVDITSSENGIRSNDISNKDKIIEFNPDGIDLSVYSNPYDNSTTISLTNEMIRLKAISDSGVFPVDEAYIDIYSSVGNIAMEGTGDLNINLETVTINGDVLTFSGAQYTNDFSGNFTNRSLVDKQYVDNIMIWTAGTGSNSAVLGNSDGVASGDYSVSEGYQTTASGISSHAEGRYTLASNAGTHAEGYYTTASGSYAHAEGAGTTASGDYSHSEGSYTIASGYASHTEGGNTTASGTTSHAEGGGTTASGDNSHAEGQGTVADGDNSHAEGYYTITSGVASHAEGKQTTASGDYAHTEGQSTTASGQSSHAEGYNSTASGNYGAHAEGGYTVANGDYAHAEGDSTTAGWKGFSIYSIFGGVVVLNSSYGDIVSEFYGSSIVIIDGKLYDFYDLTYDGVNTIITLYDTNVNNGLVIANKDNINSIYADIYNGNGSHTEGSYTIAFGDYSHAEGRYTIANGDNGSHTEGYYTTASGNYGAHAEGDHTTASGQSSHAEGSYTSAGGDYSHAEGYSNIASGEKSHAEGANTTASGSASHAEGRNTVANGYNSHAEGSYTSAGGDYSHTEGYGTVTGEWFESIFNEGGQYAHAEGYYTAASGDKSHAEGSNTTSSGDYSHAEGYSTQTNGSGSHAEGYNTTASGDYGSHAEGQSAIASGVASHAEGRLTNSEGEYAHAEGYYAKAIGSASHAEGYNTTANDDRSHAEGDGSIAYSYGSHAEGKNTNAGIPDPNNYGYFIGSYAHAEGDSTTASGNASHAEGKNTTASGNYSHAEGGYTIASGNYSSASGSYTIASGNYSSASGLYTTASGYVSHAEGYITNSFGHSSHAEGAQTTAGWLGFEIDTVVNGVITLTAMYGDVTTEFTGGEVALERITYIDYYPYSSVSFSSGTNTEIFLNDTTINDGMYVADTTNMFSTYAGISLMVSRGDMSHSEGAGTRALAAYSHVEGVSNWGFGIASHAEGQLTMAFGKGSHAEGRQTTTYGDYSHIGGRLSS